MWIVAAARTANMSFLLSIVVFFNEKYRTNKGVLNFICSHFRHACQVWRYFVRLSFVPSCLFFQNSFLFECKFRRKMNDDSVYGRNRDSMYIRGRGRESVCVRVCVCAATVLLRGEQVRMMRRFLIEMQFHHICKGNGSHIKVHCLFCFCFSIHFHYMWGKGIDIMCGKGSFS